MHYCGLDVSTHVYIEDAQGRRVTRAIVATTPTGLAQPVERYAARGVRVAIKAGNQTAWIVDRLRSWGRRSIWCTRWDFGAAALWAGVFVLLPRSLLLRESSVRSNRSDPQGGQHANPRLGCREAVTRGVEACVLVPRVQGNRREEERLRREATSSGTLTSAVSPGSPATVYIVNPGKGFLLSPLRRVPSSPSVLRRIPPDA